jgi:glycogen phosphorylase
VTVNPAALFDVQVKRIHEYKRQQLNIFGTIHRYLTLKAMSPEERKKVQPRVTIFGGKAAPGYWMVCSLDLGPPPPKKKKKERKKIYCS